MRQIKAHVAAKEDVSSVAMEHNCFTVNREHLPWAFSVCLDVNVLVFKSSSSIQYCLCPCN